MSFDKDQFKRLIKDTLEQFDNLYSKAATNLLLGTAAQESGFGKYLKQLNGPACGIFQIEPKTESDIWDNYLYYRVFLRESIVDITGVSCPNELHLRGNLIYQVVICRVKYLRVKEALPKYDDIEGLARYWKKYYNTYKGKGRIDDFIKNYHKYIL